MKKIAVLLTICFIIQVSEGLAGDRNDGSYLWNLTNITFSLNDKTELVLGNKNHYSNQIDHLDYFHIELIGYRKLSSRFSLGLGLRQTEGYKSERWNPGQTYMFYGVYFLNPWDIKIKFANRVMVKTYKTSNTQLGIDNITNIDFFTRSASKLPKPYLMDEIFSNLNLGQIQGIRLYGGVHVLKTKHFGIDFFYCYWKNRPANEWKNFNVFGMNSKFRI